MTNLGELYSKSIIRKFDYIPVYIPDTKVTPGAIISFGTNLFGKAAKPFGSFQVVSHLMNSPTYQFNLELETHSSDIEFNFVSENEVDVGFATGADFPDVAEGDIDFSFKKQGSILLYGIYPTENRIKDHFELERCMEQIAGDRAWDQFYVVTSVITCKKALVYQSNDKDGKLIVDASAKKLKIATGNLGNIGADVNFKVKWVSKQAFHTDWADNVVLFMKLKHFKKASIRSFAAVDEDLNVLVDATPENLINTYFLEETDVDQLR